MNADLQDPLSTSAKHWALKLTGQPSVTGTPDEAAFGPWLAEQLRLHAPFKTAEIWTLPVATGDERQCVLMLVRGGGRRTVILTGHYDTVSVDDYGDLRALATQPEELREALLARLAKRADTAAERRAKEDLETGAFLPGRGLLDMKSGLAAGLAAAEAFVVDPYRSGNILFVAVPDEENNSAGARRVAPELSVIAQQRDLDLFAAINLDAIADDTDGRNGRIIATGTIGKVLPTAFVAGVAAHSGFPLNGVNAAVIASAIAMRIEWAPELTDHAAAQSGTPPSLLSVRDGKAGYDVTTPSTAFATWNVLNLVRKPAEVLDVFGRLCAEAGAACLAQLSARAAIQADPARRAMTLAAVPVYPFEAVYAEALRHAPQTETEISALRAELVRSEHSLPEQCRLVTERVWTASGLSGPAIVTGFGSIPYLATELSQTANGRRLATIVSEVAAASLERYGVEIASADYFAGISDMSFLGEADEIGIDLIARNTPMWEEGVRWPAVKPVAGLPTVNIGPWGRDYHTPLERLHVGYAFDVLPHVILDVLRTIFPREG